MKKNISILLIVILGFGVLTADAQEGKRIGMKRARQIAMKEAAGKIKSSELEKEKGQWIYSFDIRNAKGTITEVNIDAYTGKVISAREENAQREADEKRLEKKKNQ